MTISQFILCVLMFFKRFRLPVQNAFKNSCQYSTGTGQKQRLPFYDISLVIQKKSFFWILWNKLVHVPEVGTLLYRVGHAPGLIPTVEIHMLVCVYIANQMPPSGSSLWVCYINGRDVIILVVEFFLTLKVKNYYIGG